METTEVYWAYIGMPPCISGAKGGLFSDSALFRVWGLGIWGLGFGVFRVWHPRFEF